MPLVRRLCPLLLLPLGGCATMALHRSLEGVRSIRETPLEIRGTFHELREARATLERVRPGSDTLRLWKIVGADLWLSEFEEHDRYFLNTSLAEALDSSNGIPSGWIRPTSKPEPWRLILLADRQGRIPGALIAGDALPNTMWLQGYRDEKDVWRARNVLSWTDSTLAMRPLMEARVDRFDPRVLKRGLYVLTVPLDVAMSPLYLVGGIGFLFLLGTGHGFGPGFH